MTQTKRKAQQELARFMAGLFRALAAQRRREAQTAERMALLWERKAQD